MRKDAIKITNNTEANCFETTIDGHLAILEYRKSKHRIAMNHTEVPDEIGGQGVAGALVVHALEYARENKLTVLPYCPFVASYIKGHPEYAELVDPNFAKG